MIDLNCRDIAMTKEERLVKHLLMIQAIINRMAQNSFFLKGWMITITAAGFWINAKVGNTNNSFIFLIAVLWFWGMDGYFLNQEKLFRHLFETIRNGTTTDFSMKTNSQNSFWLRACFSKTLFGFYGGLFFILSTLLYSGSVLNFMCRASKIICKHDLSSGRYFLIVRKKAVSEVLKSLSSSA